MAIEKNKTPYVSPYEKRRMSIELTQRKRVSKNKLDRFDRIHLHFSRGKSLNAKDQELLDRAMELYPMLCKGHTAKKLVAYIEKKGWAKKSRAYDLINATKKIFGHVLKADSDLERSIMIEMAKEAYDMAKKLEKPRDMVTAVKLIANLHDTGKNGKGMEELYDSLTLPAVIYSFDPKSLHEPTIDAEYADITEENTLPAPESN